MFKKIAYLLWMCAVGCVVGGEVIPEQNIVKVNDIAVYSGERGKLLQYIESHWRAGISIIKDKEGDGLTIKGSSVMTEVERLYELCIKDESTDAGSELCKRSSRELGMQVIVHVDRNAKLIAKLIIHR